MYPSYEKEPPKDNASSDRVQALLAFVQSRSGDTEDYAKTVMALLEFKAGAQDRIRQLNMQVDMQREREMAASMDHYDGAMREAGRRREPRMIPVPADARSVEVKF